MPHQIIDVVTPYVAVPGAANPEVLAAVRETSEDALAQVPGMAASAGSAAGTAAATQAIASDPQVISDAAAQAAALAQSDAGLVRERDASGAGETAWAHVTTPDSGRVSRRLPYGITVDGRLDAWAQRRWLEDVHDTTVTSDGQWARVWTTPTGRVLARVGWDGSVEIPGLSQGARPSGLGPESRGRVGFQVMSSIARGAGRHADGQPLPTSPISATPTSGQSGRLTLPATYTDATPLVLAICFEGVGDQGLDVRTQYAGIQDSGVVWARCTFHGDSYGSPQAMADARALYLQACEVLPIGGVILVGNSMGGIAALNALTPGTIPGVLGVYLTDPTFDLRQRYDNGRASEIRAAYGIAADGSDYAAKTAGYDPALRSPADFKGVPIWSTYSTLDTSVPASSHTLTMDEHLQATNTLNLLDTQEAGHNTSSRFQVARLQAFIETVADGPILH